VRVSLDVVRRDGLLEPGESFRLELPTRLDRGPDRVALVGVGEQDDVGADDLPDRARRAPVRGGVDAHLHLHGAEAGGNETLGLATVGPVGVTARP
jgi:hypothetical protein